MTDENMTSNRPYLIRAIHEWICDNGLTTHVLVHADFPGVEVPRDYVQNGQIILNIAPRAVNGFVANNEEIRFSARFGGVPMTIRVPVEAVLAVFARENGEGMAFDISEPPEPDPTDPDGGEDEKRPHLKVVK
jgi:stringent starvation protein B